MKTKFYLFQSILIIVRSCSGELKISKLSDTGIEGSFSAPVDGSIAPVYTVTNGTFAGKF